MLSNNPNLSTSSLNEKIWNCESIDSLKEEILPLIISQQEQWKAKIQDIISVNGYSKSSFANICGVSRITVNNWCNGTIPKSRETFIKIGMAANYDRTELNFFLTRFGHYPQLYSKCLEDCICIYVLEKYRGINAIERYDYILNNIKSNLTQTPSGKEDALGTETMDKKLLSIQDDAELQSFIIENSGSFSKAYQKLYAGIKANILTNLTDANCNVTEFANQQNWSASLRKCVSAIYQHKWYPTRNKIISLGLHLNMDHDQVDTMLKNAHMEPLYSYNLFEAVIIFILEYASITDITNRESDDYDTENLIHFAYSIMQQLEYPEINSFITELSCDEAIL